MILLSGLNDPNGIAWHNGSLYVAEINRITRYDDADAFVIANKVRHCQASFVNHKIIPRGVHRWHCGPVCNACCRQQSAGINLHSGRLTMLALVQCRLSLLQPCFENRAC